MKDYKDLNSTHYNYIEKLNYPLSESNVIYLQKLFLTNGIHNLSFNHKQSKIIINELLNSLMLYKKIAYLTNEIDSNLNSSFINLHKLLHKNKHLESPKKNLISYFFEEFNYDLLCIDETSKLESLEWFNLFKQYLIDFNYHKSMPIILISN